MAYNIAILPEAQQEIQKAYDYYGNLTVLALTNFDAELEEVYNNLEINPFYQVRYKHLRAIPFKSYPFLVFFDVDQENRTIYIYSIFHTSQNPEKYPVR